MFKVSKRTLLLIAGIVWLAAGGNIAWLGIQAFAQINMGYVWAIIPRRRRGVHPVPHEDLLEDGGQAFKSNRRLRRRQNRLLALLRRIGLHHDGDHDVGRNLAARVWPGADVVHRLLLHRFGHRTRAFGRQLPRALRTSQRRPRNVPL